LRCGRLPHAPAAYVSIRQRMPCAAKERERLASPQQLQHVCFQSEMHGSQTPTQTLSTLKERGGGRCSGKEREPKQLQATNECECAAPYPSGECEMWTLAQEVAWLYEPGDMCGEEAGWRREYAREAFLRDALFHTTSAST
jgi:hypothetical protein